MNKNSNREQAKETLNFVINEIVREITEERLPKLPEPTDMAEIQAKYWPEEYEIRLTIKALRKLPEHSIADIEAVIQKNKSSELYESFESYWSQAKQKITDDNIPIGLRILNTTEIFRNLAEYYGKDWLNPELAHTAKGMEEITKRLIKFIERQDQREIIASSDLKPTTIQPEELKSKQNISVKSL